MAAGLAVLAVGSVGLIGKVKTTGLLFLYFLIGNSFIDFSDCNFLALGCWTRSTSWSMEMV